MHTFDYVCIYFILLTSTFSLSFFPSSIFFRTSPFLPPPPHKGKFPNLQYWRSSQPAQLFKLGRPDEEPGVSLQVLGGGPHQGQSPEVTQPDLMNIDNFNSSPRRNERVNSDIINDQSWAQSAMDQWIDADSIDWHFRSHCHWCYWSFG